ncbi:hypothetical protein D3C87_1469230 [compost metagenome]
MDEGRQEAQAGEQQRQQRSDAGVAGIGQATGDGRGNGADGPDQGEDRDLGLRQAMIARQFQRHGGPEQAEGREHAALIQRALTQYRFFTQQGPERTQQLAISSAVIRLALGNGHRQHDADRGHQYRCNHKHRPPAEMVSHQAGHRTRQQNPQQQTTHDPADHPTARLFRRQVRGQRNQDLHRHRTETHQQ